MSPPTIYELCRPRADVLEGRIRDEDFAADLSQVLKGTAPELYKNPAVFFANTHPTRGLRDLFLIFLICRPRPARDPADAVQYWEDLEPRVKAAVRNRIEEFQAGGIHGVDLYLSCFGPALEEFSRHWPIKRGQPKPIGERTKKRSRAQLNLDELLGEDDHYAVSPEDALDAARREGKAWRMEQLTSGSRRAQLDPLTEWFVLAWDAFEVPQFPYDEALRLARVVGLDLDKDVVGVLAEKKASDLILWDSSTRATMGKLGPPDGTSAWIDAIHHCAHRARSTESQFCQATPR